mgnify:CR=1 FL=1
MVVPMFSSSITMDMGPRVVSPARLMISGGMILKMNRTRKVIIITKREERRGPGQLGYQIPKGKDGQDNQQCGPHGHKKPPKNQSGAVKNFHAPDTKDQFWQKTGK